MKNFSFRFHAHKKRFGVLSFELITAISVLTILIGALAAVGGTFKKANDLRWIRHTLLAAGQAQMDALDITGKPIAKDTFACLWPNVDCRIDITEGEGQWQGLQRIQLTLSAKSGRKTVKTSLVRYVAAQKELKQ
ncbi:MAG TPA: hypothetical protein PK052_10155 [Anaerohalosphaeraceae bacterium]|nr:hypothetical protein [Phycisphaerae bacterium]HOK95335.1 hypothetical protein [Anaerohalosphaeraceae bacterium]HOL32331.1 hypothetical protein [Anaerohalosphaeraceae bacterium]HOM74936.1 hypothetical protein [Anaerohalosphaeraceae bacterium]HPC64929.1 hypothetical protein [Anaerohalosphaeraceae bacterium]